MNLILDKIRIYQVNLAKYGNGVYHMAVRIYNGLHNKLKIISNNPNKFTASLKKFLHLNSYYTFEEFFKRWQKTILEYGKKKGILSKVIHYICSYGNCDPY
jgi:hypothetical protein